MVEIVGGDARDDLLRRPIAMALRKGLVGQRLDGRDERAVRLLEDGSSRVFSPTAAARRG